MKPIPSPIRTIRQVIHIVETVARSGNEILRLALPIISVVAAVAQNLKKNK